MRYEFRIFRYDVDEDEAPRFQTYALESEPSRSLLESLLAIRDEQDSSLAFRYSCREAVCGSCAVVVKGHFALACRTMLHDLGAEPIVVEPLPNLEIQKDLIVDMEPFWEALRRLRTYLLPPRPGGEGGYRIDEEEVERLFHYAGCILCGSCYAACPATARGKDYLGPAAMARLDRFVKDSRDDRDLLELDDLDSTAGVWGCHTILKCNAVCPKDVRPAEGISSLRRRLVLRAIRKMIGLER